MTPDTLPPCRCGAEPREYVCCVPARYGVDCPACGLDTLDCETEDEARADWRELVSESARLEHELEHTASGWIGANARETTI